MEYSNAITDMTFEGSVVRGRGTVKGAASDDKSMLDMMETCRDGGGRKRKNLNKQRKNADQQQGKNFEGMGSTQGRVNTEEVQEDKHAGELERGNLHT